MKTVAIVLGGMVIMSDCGFLGVLKGIDEERIVSLAGETLDARSDSGRIFSDFPITTGGNSDGRETGGLTRPKTNPVSIETSSGAVLVLKR